MPLFVMGGIGAGKSSLADFLASLGATYIDADVLGHQVLREPETIAAVAEFWPRAIQDREVDRSQLAHIVFGSQDELGRLERLTHPRIKTLIEQRVKEANSPVVVEVSVPKAAPDGGLVVIVDASNTVRYHRLVSRGMNHAQIERRMRSQPTRGEWLRLAEVVVCNDGDHGTLREAGTALWKWWRGPSKESDKAADDDH